MNNERKYRLYGLVPYNLSPIQQGIQYGHAVQEYNNLMMALSTDVTKDLRDAFDKWRKEDKTFIILNGGTTNSNPERFGTLNKYLVDLTGVGVMCVSFREPDLGDQLTAFVFLVDDRVWDRVAWPDYDGDVYYVDSQAAYDRWLLMFSKDRKEAERIAWLRNFLKQFKLA